MTAFIYLVYILPIFVYYTYREISFVIIISIYASGVILYYYLKGMLPYFRKLLLVDAERKRTLYPHCT